MSAARRVLVVDDDESMCAMLCEGLSARSFAVRAVLEGGRALDLLGAEDFDVVLTDLHMRKMGGIELCERIQEVRPGLPVVVLTAYGSLETAVASIRAGVYDFVTKPADLDMLDIALARAVQHRRLNEQLRLLREGVARVDGFEELLGDSPPMRRVYELLERVADTDVTVLISGESGTGKELVARALHRRSRRRDGQFVAVNCAALSPTQSKRVLASCSRPPVARSCSMRSLKSLCRCKRSSSDLCKSGASVRSAAMPKSRSMYASWPRPTATSTGKWKKVAFGKISSFASTSCPFTCRLSERAAAMC